MEKQYTLNPKAPTGGTFLCGIVSPKQQAIIETFFKPSLDGWNEPEKGYDELQWRFTDDSGRVFNCYRRYGSMRVGSTDRRGVDEFLAWIEEYGTHAKNS
tara:strand:+ start:125 stop:424 length:300 start_codon:yes stop_codon:yes gene_type:complete